MIDIIAGVVHGALVTALSYTTEDAANSSILGVIGEPPAPLPSVSARSESTERSTTLGRSPAQPTHEAAAQASVASKLFGILTAIPCGRS
jgi:hypothetical protein